MKLVEQGKIKTSDDLSKFFEDIPQDKKVITIHQLLTHTSGISSKTGGYRYDEAGKEDFLKEFFESELQSKPGYNTPICQCKLHPFSSDYRDCFRAKL